MGTKPKFLVIAPYLPRFDKNSGDFRLFQMLGMIAKSHEITYLATGSMGEGPENDRRYHAALTDMGLRVHPLGESFLKHLVQHRYDAAMIEFYYIADHYLPRIKMIQPRCPVIVDSVDVHYRRAFTKYGLTMSIEDLSAAEKIKKYELDVYKKSDMVITVTEEDADILKRDCAGLKTSVIPNIHEIRPLPDLPGNRNLLFVGGFSHDPNIDAVMWLCGEIFPLIREAIPGITLTIAGSNPPEDIRRFQSDTIKVTGYVPSLTPIYRNSIISVAPLRYGAGMKGKVGEAMAFGLPVVTTSIGAQGMGLVHRVNSMISDSPEEFAASVVELIRDKSLYESIRANALDNIRETCSPEIVERKIHLLFSELNDTCAAPICLRDRLEIIKKYVARRLG